MAPIISSLQQSSLTLSICNRTDQSFTASSILSTGEKADQLPKSTQDITFIVTNEDLGTSAPLSIDLTDEHGILVCNLLLDPSTKWKSAITSNQSIRVLSRSLSRYAHQIFILAHHNSASFLSSLDDSLRLTSLSLPGTHDSLSLYGWPISSCQALDSSITKQLNDGIRYLDIRLAPKGLPGKERLLAYHGITDQRIEFGKVLEECFSFLNGIGRNGTFFNLVNEEDTLV